VLVYSGLVTILCGMVSVVLPPRWLGFAKRRHGLLAGVAAGLALFAAGLLWPAGEHSTPAPATKLDAFLPAYHFHERHEIIVAASPERVREALSQVTVADIGVMQTLGRIRDIAMGVKANTTADSELAKRSVIQMISGPRSAFFPLDDTPREFVFGLAGQPWNNRAVRLKSSEFRDWAEPGNVKIAANFLIEDLGGGRSRIVTETRVAATDAGARRKMAKYWALIYPGSGLVRRSLLQAIRTRAEARM
jgi:hypothetical protein